jgi:hypothetical protein
VIIQLSLQIALVVIVLSLPIAMLMFSTSMRRTRGAQMRSLSAFDVLRGQVGRGVETGRPAHISIGVGGIVGDDTLVTLAGVAIVDSLAPEAAETGAAPTVTVADGAAMILAQDTLRRPYTRRGDLAGYEPRDVQLLGMQPFQYAAGAMDFLAHAQPVSNVMVGSFGPEAGLIVEEGVKQGLTQVAGSTDARAIAVLAPSADHLLVGEEVFAAPAYLDRGNGHIARLRAQDLARFIMAAVIVIWSILLLFA